MADRYNARIADRRVSRHRNCRGDVRSITDEDVPVSKYVRLLSGKVANKVRHLRLRDPARDTRCVTGDVTSDLRTS